MSRYTVRGSTVYVGNQMDSQVYEKLPVATYMCSYSMDVGYFLTVVPDFTLPSRIYGDAERMADRFLNTFSQRGGTTGVLLSGLKGSGKSLTMKATAIKGAKLGLPTIIVSSPFCGDNFNKFIQSIDCEAILLFDEFEKVYDETQQKLLLTLLDGVSTTKKLVIMTVNNTVKVNGHMKNRPGRLFYNINYSSISNEFIRDYCGERLNDKNKIETIVSAASIIGEFNFDMLQALVEELNRYNESVKDALHILNIKPSWNSRQSYNVTAYLRGVKIGENELYTKTVSNPLMAEGFHIEAYLNDSNTKLLCEIEPKKQDEDEDNNYLFRKFNLAECKVSSDLTEISGVKDDVRVVLKKQQSSSFDAMSLL